MAYSKIRQPKLSDVIEQQLEFLILEGTLRPGEKLLWSNLNGHFDRVFSPRQGT